MTQDLSWTGSAMADDAANLLPHEQPAPPRADLCHRDLLLRLWHGSRLARLAECRPMRTRRARSTPRRGWCRPLRRRHLVLLGIWLGVRAIRQAPSVHGEVSRRPSRAIKSSCGWRLPPASAWSLSSACSGACHSGYAATIFVAHLHDHLRMAGRSGPAQARRGGPWKPSCIGSGDGHLGRARLRKAVLCATALKERLRDVRWPGPAWRRFRRLHEPAHALQRDLGDASSASSSVRFPASRATMGVASLTDAHILHAAQ